MSIGVLKLGPSDQGRRMRLADFDEAETEEGCILELSRGIIVVSQVPMPRHALMVDEIRQQIQKYRTANGGQIKLVAGGGECKFFLATWESERHPDIAIYLTRPKGKKDRTLWRTWLPELVIEVVSESSRDRDYTDKRDEYWSLGIKEYWIVDAKLEQVLLLRRGKSDWIEKTLGADDAIESKLLTGFKLPCQAIFEAAGRDADAT